MGFFSVICSVPLIHLDCLNQIPAVGRSMSSRDRRRNVHVNHRRKITAKSRMSA